MHQIEFMKMKHTYKIDGMTCQSCVESVTKALLGIDGVNEVKVDLEKDSAMVLMEHHIDIEDLQKSLPDKYKISNKADQMIERDLVIPDEKSKLQQLRPLFLILLYIAVASVLLHTDDWSFQEMMIDFMGLFFIVFSFFKMLDLKGFSMTFSMYDPISRFISFYGKVYPFIETALGLMFLFRYKLNMALILTIIILGFTTYGVSKTLLSKRKIKCACLGTALDLPMTEATFIENALMIVMSIVILIT